ncbi:hypothetical protein MGG_16180 [Pyricularia oryzae 70-15]|uniref:Retrotransposon gag domain-containing protein n=1 Tax=Pyricularia oryzae (strain 70-15 / ATCC MYA-4617 / FGSC 8958) TaxID=242507 RepID=G4MM38_PYRO7|nr:uncharacterized protein MGG_16180 [Pyricularia oryzae 70-15]EHA56923.1 hypothetical protein MGG_16180 [Pyricularia oryzae 70-15]
MIWAAICSQMSGNAFVSHYLSPEEISNMFEGPLVERIDFVHIGEKVQLVDRPFVDRSINKTLLWVKGSVFLSNDYSVYVRASNRLFLLIPVDEDWMSHVRVLWGTALGPVPERPGGVTPLLTTLARKRYRPAKQRLPKDKATRSHVTSRDGQVTRYLDRNILIAPVHTPATNSKAAQKAPARPKDNSDSNDEEDQLRRQVAQTNQELHEQTLRATQLQKELQALRASANVTSTPLNGREKLKFNPPTTFDGTPGQLKGYFVQSASAYAAEFRRLAIRLDIIEKTKILQFYQGLKLKVKDEVSKLDRPEDFLEYVEFAIKFDNRIYERRQEKQGGQRVFVTSTRQANTGRKYQHPQPIYHKNNGGWQQPRYMAPQTYNTAYGTHSGPMDLSAT